MNVIESKKILAIIKSAFPNSFKGMTAKDADATANIWATQLAYIPYEVVSIAVKKIIKDNTFPPSIEEVKEKICGLYWEAMQEIPYQHGGIFSNNTDEIDPKRLEILKEIVRIAEILRNRKSIELNNTKLGSGYNTYLTRDCIKQIEGK